MLSVNELGLVTTADKRQHLHDDLAYVLALACLAAREYGVKGVGISVGLLRVYNCLSYYDKTIYINVIL